MWRTIDLLVLIMDRQGVYRLISSGLFIFQLMLQCILYRYDASHTFLWWTNCIINVLISSLSLEVLSFTFWHVSSHVAHYDSCFLFPSFLVLSSFSGFSLTFFFFLGGCCHHHPWYIYIYIFLSQFLVFRYLCYRGLIFSRQKWALSRCMG